MAKKKTVKKRPRRVKWVVQICPSDPRDNYGVTVWALNYQEAVDRAIEKNHGLANYEGIGIVCPVSEL